MIEVTTYFADEEQYNSLLEKIDKAACTLNDIAGRCGIGTEFSEARDAAYEVAAILHCAKIQHTTGGAK